MFSKKNFGGGVVHHGADRPDGHAFDRAHVDEEYGQPAVRDFACSRGVVRARSSIRSEYSAREVQIFWPLMT